MLSSISPPQLKTLLIWSVLLGCVAVRARSAPIIAAVDCGTTRWDDVIVFFATNYITHALTTPTAAGSKWHHDLRWSVLAMTLPFASLGKSIGLICRHILRPKGGDIYTAIARGALVVLARSKDWEPWHKEELIYVELPEDFYNIEDMNPPQNTASFNLDTVYVSRYKLRYEEVRIRSFNVHGRIPSHESFPKGYVWAMPSDSFFQDIASQSLKDSNNIHLCRSSSWIKMAISVGQLVFSSITLYRTRGEQIQEFGYAAFGLSVFPYMFMSLVNLFCVGVIGEYPYIYIVNSAVLQEAARRSNVEFDGVIGVLANGRESEEDVESVSPRYSGDSDGSLEETGDHRSGQEATISSARSVFVGRYTAAHIRVEKNWLTSGMSPEKILVVEVGKTIKRFKLQPPPPISGKSKHYNFGIGSITNQGSELRPNELDLNDANYIYPFALAFNAILFFVVLPLLVMVLPYIFIFVMTGFQRAESTASQRAWLMAWLCASQLSFLPSAIKTMRDPSGQMFGFGKSFTVFVSVLSIASIGGFVQVVMMYMASGTCALTP